MRTEEISTPVPEGSHATFKVTFKNEVKVLASPVSIYWDLIGKDDIVLAYNQEVTGVSSISYIELLPIHTRIQQGEAGYGDRLLNIRVNYLSYLGTEKVLNKQIKFSVQDLRMVGYQIEISAAEMIFTDDYVRDLDVD